MKTVDRVWFLSHCEWIYNHRHRLKNRPCANFVLTGFVINSSGCPYYGYTIDKITLGNLIKLWDNGFIFRGYPLIHYRRYHNSDYSSISYIKDRKVMYKTLFHVSPEFWDDKNRCIKKQHPNAEILNTTINQKKAELEKETLLLTLADSSISMETIRNKINNRTSFDLFEYANKYIEQLYKDGKHATYKKYKSVVKKLRFYVGNDSLPIKSISLDFIKGYENYLMNHIGNNRNTTTVNLKALAKLVGDIYRNYDMDETGNPFRKMRFKREQTDRTFLEIEEIHKIQHLKLRARNPLYDAREVFLFECYTGIRISDILTLKWKHITDEKISIRMRKTEKLLSIPINDYVRAVLDRRRCAVENNGGKITSEKYVFNILKVDVDEVSAQDALNAISSATAGVYKKKKKN